MSAHRVCSLDSSSSISHIPTNQTTFTNRSSASVHKRWHLTQAIWSQSHFSPHLNHYILLRNLHFTSSP